MTSQGISLHNPNFYAYEKLLSPFGCKVLHVLINNFRKEKNNRVTNVPKHSFRTPFPVTKYKKRKVITFEPEPTPIKSIRYCDPFLDKIICIDEQSGITKNNLSTSNNVLPLSSEELLNSDQTNINIDNNGFNCNRNYIQNDDLGYDDNLFLREMNVRKNGNGYINDSDNNAQFVPWDDVFDSEIFTGLNSDESIFKENYNDSAKLNKDVFEQIPKEFNINKEINAPKIVKRKIKVDDGSTKKARKDSSAINTGKNPFRKQSYTKAVRNWLDDIHSVNQDHAIKEQVFDEMNKYVNDIDEHVRNITKKETESEKVNNVDEKTAKSKPNKKIVQSKLANKDGVMKFKKPKDVPNEEKLISDCEKKNYKRKPKFVAPIKSQLPVKDVTYTVLHIEDDNIETFNKNLLNGSEVIMVLTYSNGFCQLNSHYADDSCTPDGVVIYSDDDYFYFKGSNNKFRKMLEKIITNNILICYDGKKILLYLKSQLDVLVEASTVKVFDAKIGGSLIDPDDPPENFTELQKLVSFVAEFTIATECPLQKIAWYVQLLKGCFEKVRAVMVECGLWNVFVDIEMPVLPIIAEMEHRGVCVDLAKLKEMEAILLTRMKEVEQQCYGVAGRTFQINSSLQVRAILYDELKLDVKCNVKIQETITKGFKSTSEAMLRRLRHEHPLPQLILEYRHLHKAHATFLAGIAHQTKGDVVKPTWVQTAAATGRVACNNPNLQAIPKTPFSLILFPKDGDENTVLNFREVYVARAGHTLLSADFKHIECRVFAGRAADTRLTRALLAQDLFAVLAAHWLNKSESDVSPEERERTKRLVYASLYGAGTRKLMEILDLSYDRALQVQASFHRTFPTLKSFGRAVVAQCERQSGRLSTASGRTRTFPHIASSDPTLKAQAERQAVNFIIQGTAADVCKWAMVRARARVGVRAHLLLHIHDELVWELPTAHLDTAAALIKCEMESSGGDSGLPALPVALAAGTRWHAMAPLHYTHI